MDTSTTEKYHIVVDWLKSTYAGGSVPEFEINKETVDALFQLAVLSKRRSQETEILIEDFSSKANEYRSEGSCKTQTRS